MMNAKKFIRIATVLCFLTMIFADCAHAEENVERARMEYVCALSSLSSYNDELTLLVREKLQEIGWEFEPHWESDKSADTKLFLITRNNPDGPPVHILAVTGTENAKDVKADLSIRRVPFDIAAAAADEDTAAVPTVHRGFYGYMKKAFLTTPHENFGGKTFGEALAEKLAASPDETLFITGHSLGGAVATLLAAYLAEAGAKPSQLAVITFGAPAVGNEAFADACRDKFRLERIVTDGDPVPGILQSLDRGYVQFGERTKRKKFSYGALMPHAMTVYLDGALKNYYDVRATENTNNEKIARAALSAYANIYVAPFGFDMDERLRDDEKYMAAALRDMLAMRTAKATFSTAQSETAASLRANAKKSGADYVVKDNIRAEPLKNKADVFLITMEEIISTADGSVISVRSASTTTAKMTPTEAVMYLFYLTG